MKEKINRYEKYALLYPIAFVIMAILMMIQGIMERDTLYFFLFIFCSIIAVMTFYLVKNHHFKNINAGYVVGLVAMLIGIISMDVLMMLSCQIPNFVMNLMLVGMGICYISYFYGAIKAKR